MFLRFVFLVQYLCAGFVLHSSSWCIGAFSMLKDNHTVFVFDRGVSIASGYAVSIPTDEFVNSLFSIEQLSAYYKEPDLLLANSNDLVQRFFSDQYGDFQPFVFGSDWADDFRLLCDNLLSNKSFNVDYRIFPDDVITDNRTGLQFEILNKWCHHSVVESLISQRYYWVDPSPPRWELGSDFEPPSAKLAVGKLLGFVVAVQDKTDFGRAMARLVFPYLFSVFYLLEADNKSSWSQSIWSKPVRLARCPNPTCGVAHFKHRTNTLWCTKRCGSTVRMRKTRERRREVVNL